MLVLLLFSVCSHVVFCLRPLFMLFYFLFPFCFVHPFTVGDLA
jgi:hypothetical protein